MDSEDRTIRRNHCIPPPEFSLRIKTQFGLVSHLVVIISVITPAHSKKKKKMTCSTHTHAKKISLHFFILCWYTQRYAFKPSQYNEAIILCFAYKHTYTFNTLTLLNKTNLDRIDKPHKCSPAPTSGCFRCTRWGLGRECIHYIDGKSRRRRRDVGSWFPRQLNNLKCVCIL